MKNQNAVSLVALIVTIIVIVILAAILISMGGFDIIKQAKYGKFMAVLSNVQDVVSVKRSEEKGNDSLEIDYDDSEYFDTVTLIEAPELFEDINEEIDGVQGKVVKLDYFNLDNLGYGMGYKDILDGTATFGNKSDDIFVFDRKDKVYYVCGYETDDETIYGVDVTTTTKLDIEISSPSISYGKKGDIATFNIKLGNEVKLEIVKSKVTLIGDVKDNNGMQLEITGSDTEYIAEVTLGEGDGEIGISIAEGLLRLKNGKLSPKVDSLKILVDNTPPSLEIEVE